MTTGAGAAIRRSCTNSTHFLEVIPYYAVIKRLLRIELKTFATSA